MLPKSMIYGTGTVEVLFILKMQQFVVQGLRTTKDLNANPNADPDLYQTWIRNGTVPLPNAVVRYGIVIK
jgi:hypothetical protein